MRKLITYHLAKAFAATLTALLCLSCEKEVPFLPGGEQLSSSMITFGLDSLFTAEVQTKATEVTSLSSFYVTAATGSPGSENFVWNSEIFSQVPGSNPAIYTGNKYWPESNPGYVFLAANVPLTFTANGCTVAATNATDVVVARQNGTYKEKTTLSFEHIFARLCRVDIVAASGYTLSNISMSVTPKTGGTYNLRTAEWSSVSTGSATPIASSTGANNNDIFLVPGVYSITASWVATDANGTSVTHTNEVCNVPLASGKTNNISCVLGGDITSAPALPATTLADYCYNGMFSGCTSLTSASALPATTLANNCYQNMFRDCKSLMSAPELPATTLVSNCYGYMFQNCSSLNYIKALFTTTPSYSYTNGWVNGVASTGTFVKSSAATWDVTGANGVPTGWTVMTE